MDIKLIKTVWRLALPVLLTNLLQSLVSVVDVYMVGRLGPIAIAAVGMGNVVRMLVLVMVLAVSAGSMSLIAQAKGARDPEQMSFVTRQAISSGFLLSLLLMAIGLPLARPLLLFANSGGEPEAVILGTAYLQILFLGMPFLILNNIFDRLMQGAGDTITPLLLTGSLNLFNILFNYIFMFGLGPIPAFGVQGAAMGTIIARATGVLLAFVVIYSGRNVVKILPGSYKPDWRMFTDIFSIGVPSGIQGLFRNGSRLLVVSIVAATEVGTYGVAALSIGLQVESLAFMPVLGLNVAATSLVGQALGSWQTETARQRGNSALLLGIGLMVVLVAPIIIFAPAILRLFDPSAHPIVQSAGTAYMRINTVALPIGAVAMVANGALRGAGDSTPGMMSTLIGRAIGGVALAYLLAVIMGYGSLGVWWALALSQVFEAVYMIYRWRGEAWLRVALRKTAVYRQHLHHLPEQIQQQFLREIRTPLMATPTALELVQEDGVVYQLPDGDKTVHFTDNNYILV
ncbi:MAG: MATE family efflux transporter [Ardenticatenaceae bacterium]|nr:MATE family efflux transporter [Ardenticatenaceae bacterium]